MAIALRSQWTNNLLHTTSFIYRIKQELQTAHGLRAFGDVIALIAAEMWLAIISIPAYLAAKQTPGDTQATAHYHVRRVITLSVVGGILLIWLLKLITILILAFYIQPQQWQISETQRTQDLPTDLITVAIPLAEVSPLLRTPVITEVKNLQRTLTIAGTAQPNDTVAISLMKTSGATNVGPKIYAGSADATGRFAITEDLRVFSLPRATYSASAVSFDQKTNTKSAESAGVTFTLNGSPWQNILLHLDTALNVLAILFVIMGLTVTVLTL